MTYKQGDRVRITETGETGTVYGATPVNLGKPVVLVELDPKGGRVFPLLCRPFFESEIEKIEPSKELIDNREHSC